MTEAYFIQYPVFTRCKDSEEYTVQMYPFRRLESGNEFDALMEAKRLGYVCPIVGKEKVQ